MKSLHKGNSQFCAGVFIPQESKKLFNELKDKNFFKNCDNTEQFVKELAGFMSNLNAMHPFCEGNGRTQRIFINQLARNAGYNLDLNLTPKEVIVKASIEAMNHRYTALENIINNCLEKSAINTNIQDDFADFINNKSDEYSDDDNVWRM